MSKSRRIRQTPGAAGAAQVEVREGFTQGLHGDSAVRVRPRAPTTHSPLPSSPSSLEKSSVLPLSAAGAAQVEVRERFTQGSHGDSAAQVEVREGFTQGSHGDSAVRGALTRASHALPSSFFSLLSTMEAHCKVTTHYLLPSSPYSLLLLFLSCSDCGENLREELFFSGEDTCHIVDILPDLLIWQCLGNALRGE